MQPLEFSQSEICFCTKGYSVLSFSFLNFLLFLQLLGPGPHTPKQRADVSRLGELRGKALQIMNQFGASTLINLSNFSTSSAMSASATVKQEQTVANSTAGSKVPGTTPGGGRASPDANQVKYLMLNHCWNCWRQEYLLFPRVLHQMSHVNASFKKHCLRDVVILPLAYSEMYTNPATPSPPCPTAGALIIRADFKSMGEYMSSPVTALRPQWPITVPEHVWHDISSDPSPHLSFTRWGY